MKFNKSLLVWASIALTNVALAQSPDQKGLQIAQEAAAYDEGFKSSRVNLTMTLKNRHGQESTREMTTETLELIEDGDKSLIVFQSPRDVKGTSTLTYTQANLPFI